MTVEVIQPPANAIEIIHQPARVVEAVAAGPQGPKGDPGPAGAGYDFAQASASAVWTINHNLGYRPGVSITDTGGQAVNGDVLHTSLNQTVITFAVPIAGRARLV